MAVESQAAMRVGLWTLALGVAAAAILVLLLVPGEPVPGGVPAPVPAESVFSATEIERAQSYSSWARIWSFSSLAISILVAGILGFSARVRRIIGRLPGPWWVQSLLVVAAVSLIGRLVTLPFSVALRQLRLREGLSTQSWVGYARDLVVNELLAVAITGSAVVFLAVCVRRWRRAWPALVGGGLALAGIFGSFVYPALIEPLFNNFSALPAGELRTQVLALAQAEGVELSEVLVADASSRTTSINAYVSGFGSTRRVVVYDTLLNGSERRQVLAVVAHELAHVRTADVVVGTALGATGGPIGAGVLAVLIGLAARRGTEVDLGRPGWVPWLLALVAVGGLLLSPVQSAISRQLELRADVAALTATKDPAAFVALQRNLSVRALADPYPPPITQFWFGSHPPALVRVALASP